MINPSTVRNCHDWLMFFQRLLHNAFKFARCFCHHVLQKMPKLIKLIITDEASITKQEKLGPWGRQFQFLAVL
jgi:hypothetical protein